MDYEYLIIGAGVIGLACATRFSRKGPALIVERRGAFGEETSSRNSEVIHAGIYYPPCSLKAELCVPGNRSLYEWCEKYKIPHKRTGKFIIAVDKAEEETLHATLDNALQNGVQGIRPYSIDTFRKEEPHIKACAALYSPDTGIIDSHKLMESLEFLALQHGADFAYKHDICGLEKIYGGYKATVAGPSGEVFFVKAEKVLNAGGLDSDRIAAMAGIDIKKEKYDLEYCRGHYFKINSAKKGLANRLIYPAPIKGAPNLGIHITIEVDGELKLGPDAEYLGARVQDYSVDENLREKFYDAASRYIKGLEIGDLYPGLAGIRPKLQKKNQGFRDFIIREESDKGLPGLINMIGIESPGLTCCIEISKYIEQNLDR